MREDDSGRVLAHYHPALAPPPTRAAGLPDERAVGLAKAETLIASAIQG